MNAFVEVFFPVFALMAIGFAAARRNVLHDTAVKAMSDMTFFLLTPALLFRSMATSHIEQLSLSPAIAYYGAAVPIFAAVAIVQMRRRRGASVAAAQALCATFSNSVMLGIPVIQLLHGYVGLAVLLTIIAFNSLILLGGATIVLEVGRSLDRAASVNKGRLATFATALRAATINPVVLPVVLGAFWSLSGVPLPGPVVSTLGLLGTATSPLCLLLLGASLAQFGFGSGATAWTLTLIKSIVHPALVYCLGRFLLGLDGIALTVATITASLPIGNNVYLFARRYDVEVANVGAAVVLSTLFCLVTLPVLLFLLG